MGSHLFLASLVVSLVISTLAKMTNQSQPRMTRFMRFTPVVSPTHLSTSPRPQKMPAAVAMNGPTPVPEVNGTENDSVVTTTKKSKLTRNQLKRERKKQKKVQSQAHSRTESKEGSAVVEIEEKASSLFHITYNAHQYR